MPAIRRARAELMVGPGAVHGEGPAWDMAAGLLLWVDLLGDRLHRTSPDGSDAITAYDQAVCAVVPRADGGLALALGDGFWLQDPDGALRRVYELAQPEPPLAAVRMNDGKCDPAGRFWAGSMAFDGRPGAGSLYRLDPDGQTIEILRNVTVSNGLAWTQDGMTMYYIDSGLQRVDAFDVEAASGAIVNRRVAVTIPAATGTPDGMAIDDNGGLWVAMWGGNSVHRYTPDGRLDSVVDVPCANATSCAFGGSDLGDLYITTSRHGLTESEQASQPLAGGLFRFRPGVTGPAAVPFAG
jgi:sugar lactone lactonase YvrE